MLVMAGPMAMVAFVLLASGLLKLAQPEPARATLRRLGLPGGTATARMLGVAEVLVALLALGVGGSAVGF